MPAAGAHVRIEPMTGAHADAVLEIYQAGIEEGNATFETSVPDWTASSAAVPMHPAAPARPTDRYRIPRTATASRTTTATSATPGTTLFVCTHNAGRSQMAAALLNQHGAGRVRVTSAGSA